MTRPRYNLRVLTVFLLVSLPVLGIGALLILGSAQSELRASYGVHLSQLAERTVAAVDAYVFRRIIDVTELARVPDVREVAAAGSARPLDREAVRSLDRAWQADRQVPESLAMVLENTAARFLADITANDPIYKEILVTDRAGRLVAASNVTSDYYQADEPWWQEAFDDGIRGRVSLSDVGWDESARVYAIEIAVPIADPATGQLGGVLKVVADSREMITAVSGGRFGETGESVLLREDGTIVFSPRSADRRARFFATDLLREQLEMTGQRAGDPQFRMAFTAQHADGGQALIGAARSQLGTSYPNLSWLVAVSQAEEELFAPVQRQVRSLFLLVTLTAIAVLLAALYLSVRLAAPPVEIDMHLVEHAKIPRIEEADA